MSQENVELVMRLVAAPGVDLVQALRDDNTSTAWAEANERFFRPDFKSVRGGLPDGKTFTGLDGLREMWLEWVAPWTTYRVEFEEVIDSETVFFSSPALSGALRGARPALRRLLVCLLTALPSTRRQTFPAACGRPVVGPNTRASFVGFSRAR